MSKRRKDILLPIATAVVDALAIEAAFLLSYWLRFSSPLTSVFSVTKGYPPLEAYLFGSLFVIPVWLWLFSRRGMYATRRTLHFSDEFFALVRLVFVGMLVVMAAAFFYRTFSYSRIVFALLGLTSILTVSLGRWSMLRFEQWWYRQGRDLQRVVVAGSGAIATRLVASLRHNPGLGYQVVGTVSTEGSSADQAVPRLGSIEDLPRIVADQHIDLVLLAFGETDHATVNRLVRSCDGLNVELMMLPDLVELLTSRVRVREIDGMPFLRIKGVALTPFDAFVKRTFDLVAAVLILLLISPVFLLLALLVKLTSRGPVFYFQERIGLDGEPFQVMKFRSMRTDAESSTGPVWAAKNDPRTTPVGKFLRRFSLDELPQLLNVIRGDMSLVGPRPERPHFVEQFRREIPKYLERHRVRTGMTGWAQVNGLRGNAPIDERTRYDIYYVENWSLVFDLKIISKTIRAVLFGEDAY
ncbi:MAG: undecaprenyl-phosphate glucose phosphotransferase [Bacteroidetes bacterium]|nr:undecaprenyl-phosphate glucose phosphotransferase [Bacteroidota bacterium]